MKKFKVCIFPLIIIAIFCFTSCGPNEPADLILSNPNTNPNPETSKGTFKVDFNDATWTTSINEATILGGYISIAATNAKGESFVVLIEGTTAGTYAANVNVLAFVPSLTSEYGYWGLNDDNPNENTGSVTISSINTTTKTISGTFNFKGYWDDPDNPKAAIEFTNGAFQDISYTTDSSPSTSPSTNSFSVKLDGSIFTPEYINALDLMGHISIIARKGPVETIGVLFSNTIVPGTYDLSSFGDNRGEYIKNNNMDGSGIFGANVGTVTINKHDKLNKKIEGTFKFTANSFVVSEEHNITEGSFSVSY